MNLRLDLLKHLKEVQTNTHRFKAEPHFCIHLASSITRCRDPARTSPLIDFVHSVHKNGSMGMAYVSGRVPARFERLVAKQARAARTSKSDLVARYVMEKSLEAAYPGISFRDTLSGREAHLSGHRVAVWEVLAVAAETGSIDKTADHFRWPAILVRRALDYAKAFPDEVRASQEGETDVAPVAG